MRRSCAIRFVYGEDTRQDIRERIERALRNKEEYRVEVKFHFYSDRETQDETSQSCQLDIGIFWRHQHGFICLFSAN